MLMVSCLGEISICHWQIIAKESFSGRAFVRQKSEHSSQQQQLIKIEEPDSPSRVSLSGGW